MTTAAGTDSGVSAKQTKSKSRIPEIQIQSYRRLGERMDTALGTIESEWVKVDKAMADVLFRDPGCDYNDTSIVLALAQLKQVKDVLIGVLTEDDCFWDTPLPSESTNPPVLPASTTTSATLSGGEGTKFINSKV